MRRAQRLLLVLALGVAVACAGGVSVPALAVLSTAPVAPYDALTIHGGPGAIPSGGMVKGSQVYDASNATLTARTSGRYFSITAAPVAGGWATSSSVAAPVGETLVAGTTYPTTSLSADASQTYFSFFGPNSNCGYLHGSLTVQEIARDATSGAVTTREARRVRHFGLPRSRTTSSLSRVTTAA